MSLTEMIELPAANPLSVASRENFTFHGHTSWDVCRYTHFEIPLSTGRLTLRESRG